jgi:GTPase SAR1 family protein
VILPQRHSRIRIQTSDRLARVAVLGLGGAGKTTLIKSLTGCNRIDPRISNRGISLVIVGREEKSGWWWFGRTTRTSIIYCDTEGQKQETFVRSMLEADKNDIIHRGCFDALIFVVDIKPPARSLYRDDEIVESVDWPRLDEHVKAWNDLALALVFETISTQLKLCLVFVNKCNLVRELSGSEKQRLRQQILDNLAPFTQRLQRFTRGVLLRVVMGSARDIEEVGEVRALIDSNVLK